MFSQSDGMPRALVSRHNQDIEMHPHLQNHEYDYEINPCETETFCSIETTNPIDKPISKFFKFKIIIGSLLYDLKTVICLGVPKCQKNLGRSL